ncbi:glycerol kinase [Desulfopila sp. IMCC35006]|nr:glycerol kinase [Desulfopila sp. IMCC35006]
MFVQLVNLGLIEKKGEVWSLTNEGVSKGGKFIDSKQYGKYITWPDDIKINVTLNEKLITSTIIGKQYGLSANKINFLLSEIGWVYKGLKGWLTTPQGVRQGAIQDEDKKSGIPYVRWPELILENKILQNSVEQIRGTKNSEEPKPEETTLEEKGFREKFEAKHRATDGHFVRSKAEMLIDNWLYMAEIVHAYERKLPIEEDAYCDFYIPTGKVYIEYWGFENEQKYLKRKEIKRKIYEKYDFNLIELKDEHVQNLDDILPRLLLKYGIQAY